jgi:hypothetical protein
MGNVGNENNLRNVFLEGGENVYFWKLIFGVRILVIWGKSLGGENSQCYADCIWSRTWSTLTDTAPTVGCCGVPHG